MKTMRILLIISLMLFASSVNASVFINEIELNPFGTDSGNEWIEIFNNGEPINLSGWYIQNKNGDNYTFDVFVSNFYVLDGLNGLTNVNQTLKLFDSNGLLKDIYSGFYDEDNDEGTWSRMPDGTGDFVFQENTKGFPNQPTLIDNKNSTPSCILSGDNITLSADVTGFCVDKVTFSVNDDGEWMDFTGNNIGGIFQAEFNSVNLSASENIQWTVFSTDCFNITVQDGTESFYLNSATILSITPASPNGLNGWYITEPLFTLINDDANDLFYQWDSQEEIEYGFPFGLEDTPNNATLSGGILELNYNGEVCNEKQKRKVIKTDFSDPEIENLFPADGEVIGNLRPRISAFLNEIYQSNSGIDKNESDMYLDGDLVNSQISEVNSLDAEIVFTPAFDLSGGMHEVEVKAKDESGRESSMLWTFNISLNNTLDFNVYMPENRIYGDKRVPFNVSASEEFESIEYINFNDNIPKWRVLCTNCDEYGFLRKKTKTLLEGENNLTIKGVDKFGSFYERKILLFVESKKPKIVKTMPEKGFTNGMFTIEFEEDNPINASLNYGNTFTGFRMVNANLSDCEIDKKKRICEVYADLFDYDDEEIEYYFRVDDIANNSAASRTKTLFVDITPPIINAFGYEVDGRRVEFMFNITESNLQRISYVDNNDVFRSKTICIKLVNEICSKKISFSIGEHNLTIEARDKAGNIEYLNNIAFDIV